MRCRSGGRRRGCGRAGASWVARWLRPQARASEWLAKLRLSLSSTTVFGFLNRGIHERRLRIGKGLHRRGTVRAPCSAGTRNSPLRPRQQCTPQPEHQGQSIRKHDGISLELRLRLTQARVPGPPPSDGLVTCCIQRVTERAGRRTMSLSQELSCWESNHHGDSGTSVVLGGRRYNQAMARPPGHHRRRRRDRGLRHRLRARPARRVRAGRRRADGRAWERPRRLPAFSRPTSKAAPPTRFSICRPKFEPVRRFHRARAGRQRHSVCSIGARAHFRWRRPRTGCAS